MAIEVEVLRLSGLRVLTSLVQGRKHGPESSISKVYYSELDQRMAAAGNGLTGPYGQLVRRSESAPVRGEWAHREVTSRAVSIFSGTNQIQRNIIAERVLGLPRR